MKIAIVGSRDYPHLERVSAYVAALPADTVVISGGARGVDKTAEQAALKRWDLQVQIYPAEWETYGKSSGTAHTIKLARKAGKPVEIIGV